MWPFDSKSRQLMVELREREVELVQTRIRADRARATARAYAGAIANRLTADWITSSTSADAEIRSSLPVLRNRSRQLVRDNDYVRSAMRTIKNNVVGQGVGMQSQARMQRGKKLNENLNRQIEAAWWKWCRKDSVHTGGMLCFSEIEQLLVGSVASDGEVLVRLITQRMGASKVPLALEIIESDLLDDGYNGIADGSGNQIKMGVEVNKWGRPVAYYFHQKHPGDVGYQAVDRRQNQRLRVPANEVLHLMISERAGQTRGVPWLASAIMRLRHMGGYEEAEVIAARVGASTMGFVESPQGEIVGDDVVDGERVTDFEPGTFRYLAPGEKVTVPAMSRPGGQFDPFIRAMIRGVSAGVGPSYESISKDYSQSNYSSSRLALLDERDHWRVLQGWLIANFHQAVFERWLDLAVLSGEVSIPDYETNQDTYKAPRWMPRGWSWVDPAKEIMAYKDAVRCGFMTQAEVIAQTGGDLEELIVQREREVKLAAEKGLVFDTDPKTDPKAVAAKEAPVEGAGESEQPPKKESKE